jgi:hypothetical protein
MTAKLVINPLLKSAFVFLSRELLKTNGKL